MITKTLWNYISQGFIYALQISLSYETGENDAHKKIAGYIVYLYLK